MNRLLTFRRLSLLFLGLFGLSVGGILLAQKFYFGPEKKCIAEGRWWWAEGRECVTPLYLPEITGRPAGMSRAEASDRANRELLAVEDRLRAEDAARRAATARDTAALKAKEGI